MCRRWGLSKTWRHTLVRIADRRIRCIRRAVRTELAKALDVPVLARIPFDPALGMAADEGHSYLCEHPDRPAARAFTGLADRLQLLLDAS